MNDYRGVDPAQCGFHIRAYERLRSSVVDPACAPFRHGLAVLIRCGMLAWMCSYEAPHKQPRPSSGVCPPAALDACMGVWAEMMRPHLEMLNHTGDG